MKRQDNSPRELRRRMSDAGSNRRYQPRDIGTGYGRSSGYALPRQYTSSAQRNRAIFVVG